MMSLTKSFLTVIFSIFVLAASAHGATVNAASCSATDVQTAVNSANDGDTVVIPAGTCSWTSAVSVSGKSLTIQGQTSCTGTPPTSCSDTTVIQDNISAASATGFVITVPSGKKFRLTGLTFQASANRNPAPATGFVSIMGGSTQVRADHLHFNAWTNTNNTAVLTDNILGVFDHILFTGGFAEFIVMGNSSWNGTGSFGDNSWSQADSMGTANALYIEDSNFVNSSATPQSVWDCDGNGCRYVIRHNTFNMYFGGHHGTETPGRPRSGRQFEIYSNTFTADGSHGTNLPQLFVIRGGTGVIYSNTLTAVNGASPASTSGVTLQIYRAGSTLGNWGACDGSSPWDKNDGVVYDSGTYTGASGATSLTDNSKNWTANKWVQSGSPYSIHNVTQNNGSEISGNTTNTISYIADHLGNQMTWNNGDSYQILRASYCIDQPGRGQGAVLSGNPASPTGDPQEAIDPVYIWNNPTMATQTHFPVETFSQRTIANRDYIYCTDTSCAKPGYTAYTYPHPLTQGTSSQGPPPPTPKNPVVQ